MVQSHNKSNWGILRLGLFAFAVCSGILGCILALDAFFPKEKPVTPWTPLVEFSVGVVFLALAFYVGRKNRLMRKRKAEVSGAGSELT
jgi:peptidoglycan/LPS O-acetylase OafA/YrhL